MPNRAVDIEAKVRAPTNGIRDGSAVYKAGLDIIMNYGGLGDQICRLPAIKQLIEIYGPQLDYRIFMPRYFLEVFHKAVPEAKFISTLDMHKPLREKGRLVVDFTPLTFTSMRMHLVANAFVTLLDKIPTEAEMEYLKLPLDDQPPDLLDTRGDYVVITTGFTAPVRAIRASTVNGLVEYLIRVGLTPVFLGKAEAILGDERNQKIKANFNRDIDYSKGVDLREKTSLIEAAHIMAKARAVVGLDNGLLHLAAMTDVPIVAAYTSVEPDARLPIRNGKMGWRCVMIEPDEELQCRGCQTYQNFSRHDYKYCAYGDYQCLDQITAGKMIGALKQILSGGKHI